MNDGVKVKSKVLKY